MSYKPDPANDSDEAHAVIPTPAKPSGKIPFYVAKIVIIILMVALACALGWRPLVRWFPAAGLIEEHEAFESIVGTAGWQPWEIVGTVLAVMVAVCWIGCVVLGCRWLVKGRQR